MKSSDLKEYIVDEQYIETILEDLNCGHIVKHNGYYTCSNPDGNNPSAVTVYENYNLTVINYTRDIAKNKRSTDIFDLVSFYKDCSFPEALKYVHVTLGLDYYQEKQEVCESIQLLHFLQGMSTEDYMENSQPLKPISEKVLSYYLPHPNKMFIDDNINYDIQQEFNIGYDPHTNRITIPIYDSIGSLVGVKGRLYGEPDEINSKYLYIIPTNKSAILYGYWQNKDVIKNSRYLYIVESEKGLMQLASMGVRNAVSTGGKKISKTQVELITRICCIPIIAFDKDVDEDELKSIADMFGDKIDVFAIVDNQNLLNDKESPMDRPEAWFMLCKDCVYQIKSKGV